MRIGFDDSGIPSVGPALLSTRALVFDRELESTYFPQKTDFEEKLNSTLLAFRNRLYANSILTSSSLERHLNSKWSDTEGS